jgi:hypothetical protein
MSKERHLLCRGAIYRALPDEGEADDDDDEADDDE